MKSTVLYRIAAVLLVIFAAGHTVGFLKFEPPTAEGVAVRDAMDKVHFPLGSSSFSYGGFYRGFGLFATIYLLFAAFLAWHLGSMAQTVPQSITILGWAFFALQAASLVLCWRYFLVPPIILSALLSVCTGWAAWMLRNG